MKKLSIIAVLVVVGLAGGFAFAKSMSVPWFIDNAPAGAYNPPNVAGMAAIIYLHNNKPTEGAVCTIQYYSQDGYEQIRTSGTNTFTIAPNSTIAFRPVADDPASAPGGQESPVAQLVPNRPTTVDLPNHQDGKKNGGIVITWSGAATDVVGLLYQTQYTAASGPYQDKIAGPGLISSYETLLPAGS